MQGSKETGLGESRISGKLSREGDLWTEFGWSDEEFSKWNKVWKRISHRGPAGAQKMHMPGGLDHGHVSPQRSIISLTSPVIVTCSTSVFPTESWVQTEAMSYLFLYSQHIAHAWHAVRIPNKYRSNDTEFKFRWGHSVGSLPNPASLLANPRSSPELGLREETDYHDNSLFTVKNEACVLLLVQK